MRSITDAPAIGLSDVIARTGNPLTTFRPRVSGHGQIANGSQQRQLTAARQAIESVGGRLIHIFENGKARPGRLRSGWRDVLRLDFAATAELGAHYCVYNLGRLIRAEGSHGQLAPFILPTAEEISTVFTLAAEYDVYIGLIDPPDLDGRKLRSRDTKRGMALGGRPGRPQSIDTLPRRTVQMILALHVAGESRRVIAGMVGQPESTVRAVVSAGGKGA